VFITPDGLLAHWHGHRRLTRRLGQYPGVLHDLILYVVDNEVHHRGQGYVHLRALGIEPPAFYDRS
jgi:uncharacterized damage-inducible protein DinB